MIRLEDVVKGILKREGDSIGANYLKYMSVAKDVYRDLNLHVIRYTKRYWVSVDKKTNSIKLPDGYLFFSSVSIEDECGKLVPLVINSNLKSDIIDITQDKNCHCECGCNSSICGNIKNYESTTEMVLAKMPNGSDASFAAITRKKINSDGSMVIERRFPKAIYEDSVWVDTRIVAEEEFLCKVEVKDCGCVIENNSNREKITACCGTDIESDCGCTYKGGSNTYSFNEESTRIIFPSSFDHSRVLLRCFIDLPLKEIQVPIVAKKAIMYGIKAELMPWDKREGLGRSINFSKLLNNEKRMLRELFNRFSLKEFYDYTLGNKKMV